MNPHRHDIKKLYAHLHSSARGLSQSEAVPLAGEVWLFIVPFGLGMRLLEESRKVLMRRRIGNGRSGTAVRQAVQ